MVRKRSRNAFSCALVGLACVTAIAARPAARDIIHVPDDYPTIQEAIDAAGDGDEIIVAEGEYFENINLLGKPITLRSTDPEDPDVVANTIINADGNGRVVTCDSDEGPDTVLSGFTLTGGWLYPADPDSYGGGMLCFPASPMVTHCVFTENWAAFGGGMFNGGAGSEPTVMECSFTSNHAYDCGGGMVNSQCTATVMDCVFVDNEVWDQGGGMYNSSSDVTVTGCTFSENVSTMEGAGMYSESSDLVVMDCAFDDNVSVGGTGGGGMRSTLSTLLVVDCTFARNSAAGGWGAGILTYGNEPVVLRCTFSEHLGSALRSQGQGTLTVVVCTFVANSSGIYAYQWFPSVANCAFIGNTNYGMWLQNANLDLTNSVFSANGGRALWAYTDTPSRELNIIGCTFIGHTNEEGRTLWCGSESGDPHDVLFSNCIIWNHGDEFKNLNGSTINVTYTCINGGYEGEGNIEDDPALVDPDGPDDIPGTVDDDLRLRPGSPCIDAGDNTVVPPDTFDLDGDGDTEEPIPFDLDGNPRFVDDPETEDTGNGEPPIVDMGAYEYQPPECPADFDGDGDVDTADLLYLLGAWGTPAGDVDGDGDTDTADLLALLGAWGECP